jgi:hypothetical protein
MRANAASQAIVGLPMNKVYAPRVWLDGFRSIPQWDSKGIMTRQGKRKIWPEYIIGCNQGLCASRTDREFFNKMVKGQTQYEELARFDKQYFRRKTLLWKYCLKFFKKHPRISPRIMIYKKKSDKD